MIAITLALASVALFGAHVSELYLSAAKSAVPVRAAGRRAL
jgi:hypothetical protein